MQIAYVAADWSKRNENVYFISHSQMGMEMHRQGHWDIGLVVLCAQTHFFKKLLYVDKHRAIDHNNITASNIRRAIIRPGDEQLHKNNKTIQPSYEKSAN